MGLFDFFKPKRHSPNDQAIVDQIATSVLKIAESPMPQPISPEEYAQLRQREIDWLERRYDFNTIEGIRAIPEVKNPPRPSGGSVTGAVYYYLKAKAHEHEKAGNIELAIACFKKSIILMRLQYGASYGLEESYSFVRMLARNGFLNDAMREKNIADEFYETEAANEDLGWFRKTCRDASALRTDLLIMSVTGAACPECAKYQGRVFSVSGKSKLFPPLPKIVWDTGAVHHGCHHTFSPYIHNVNDPCLEYTLSVHPLKRKSYGKDIVTFSNRPFEDDRTPEAQAVALEEIARQEETAAKKKLRDDGMIEREYQKWQDKTTLDWLQQNFPEKSPKTVSSFRRMRTQNTKTYQSLKQLASEKGREI